MMKNLNRNLVAGGMAFVLLSAGASAFAKGGFNNASRDGGGLNTDYIYSELALSEEQQAQVTNILDAHFETRAAMRQSMQAVRNSEQSLSPEEMDAIRTQNRAAQTSALADQLAVVLTPSEVASFTEYMDAHRPTANMKGARGNQGASPSGDGRQGGGYRSR